MWEYAGSSIREAMKKYGTGIISGAVSMTLTCFSLGCDGPNYRNRGLTLRDVQNDLHNEMIVLGDGESYTKYTTGDGSKIVIIRQDGSYGIYNSSTGEDLTSPRAPTPSQQVVVIGDHSFDNSIHELRRIEEEARRDTRRINMQNRRILYQIEIDKKLREMKRRSK